MQQQHFDQVIDSAWLHNALKQPSVKPQMQKIADSNTQLLTGKLLDYDRTPTGEELEAMHTWAYNYKMLHSKASKREIRKATQEHFHIRIYK